MMKLVPTVMFSAILIATTCCNQKAMKESHEIDPYSEPHRPQFHFSPPEKWMNDPNGMVFYAGEYHLFYQYYPDSTVWGPMHWGHAISTDLIHWEHLPVALYPDSLGMIFSGSAVVDWKNSSGLGINGQPPIIAIFTYHDMDSERAGAINYQTQGMAYSQDKGHSWTKYSGNPILNNPGIKDFRDPKVFWYEEGQKWIMTLAVHDHVSFYSSKNLKNWVFESDFGMLNGSHDGVWECPDLFPLRIEGKQEIKWVLLLSINPGGPNGGSATQYFVGDFDGKTFKNDSSQTIRWLDAGRDNYAGVTWSDIPKDDGRRLFLGWMSNWLYGMTVPTEKWRSAMTLPRELRLHRAVDGYRLYSSPVEELKKLREKEVTINSKTLAGELDITSDLGFAPSQMELLLEFELTEKDADFGIEISNAGGDYYRIGYNAKTNNYYSDRTNSSKMGFSDLFAEKVIVTPGTFTGNTLRWHIFFDVASVELFADSGAVVMTEIFFPNRDFNNIKLYALKGSVNFRKGSFYSLKSIWK